MFEASEALQKPEGTKKLKTTLFHWYSWNSEVETTWNSLICWRHRTSTPYQRAKPPSLSLKDTGTSFDTPEVPGGILNSRDSRFQRFDLITLFWWCWIFFYFYENVSMVSFIRMANKKVFLSVMIATISNFQNNNIVIKDFEANKSNVTMYVTNWPA